jgi:ABC-2 type transport system permease protein
VADLAKMSGVFEQIRLVAGLRWKILKNNLQRKNNRWDFIGMIFAGITSAAVVLGLCFAFYAGAYAFLEKGQARSLAFLYWAIFLWWQVFPIFVAGFGANFEFRTLLRFPLSLRAFYVLGLGYGLADFAAVSSILWLIAMLAGAATARWDVVPVMLLISALFVMLNVTLERLVGSWLERILARRRARELFLGIFVLAIVSLNFMTPLLQRYGRVAQPRIMEILPYLSWLPGSLAGEAVASAARIGTRGILAGTVGLLAWTVITSAFLWQRFVVQYRGEELSETPAPTAAKKKERRSEQTEEWLRFVPATVAAVMAKEFRYLTRSGFAFMTLLLPPIMVVFFTMQFAGETSQLKQHGLSADMFYPAIMAYLILILMSQTYNSFAFEGKGVQSYFMAPVRFQDVLLGKNLFLVALVTVELTLSVGLLIWRIGLPSLPMFVATLAGGMFGVTGQLAIANWSSLSFPRKMEIGKMKGQRNSGVAVWIAFGVQIVLGGVCTMVLFAERWLDTPWAPAVAFAGLTVASVGGYSASLKAMNDLAEKKKELLIETLCR